MNNPHKQSLRDILLEKNRRKIFPTVNHGIYLNNAAVAPLPQFSIAGYHHYAEICSKFGEKHWETTFPKLEETRCLIAEYLGCETQEIAFTRNVSEGLSILASGYNWGKGDEILFSDIEFPANVYPWLNLQCKGVKTGYVKNFLGRTGIEEIRKAVTSSTKLVSISSVQFFSGYRAELEEIGRFLHERDILFCIDAVQHIGAFPLDVRKSGVDFLAGGIHKWLMCGEGLGFIYCKKELADRIKQQAIGWQSVCDWSEFFKHDFCLKPGALKFETGGISVAGLYALNNSLKFIKSIGLDEISRHILSLSALVRKLARERGFKMSIGEAEPSSSNCSGISTFSMKGTCPEEVVSKLAEKKIYVSAREGHIRVSPNYYNIPGEIEELFGQIDQVLEQLSV